MKLKRTIDKDKLFFTSDTHFGHENIIKYCDRPWAGPVSMNNALIDNWNKVVPEDGIVFHLGDFALQMGITNAQKVFQQLNGEKYLVRGNHESLGRRIKGWAGIEDIIELQVEDPEITYDQQHLVMCHYPMIVWNASHRGSWQLFGHVHGGLSNKGEIYHKPTQLDVGVDSHEYSPISYQTVKEIITKQSLA